MTELTITWHTEVTPGRAGPEWFIPSTINPLVTVSDGIRTVWVSCDGDMRIDVYKDNASFLNKASTRPNWLGRVTTSKEWESVGIKNDLDLQDATLLENRVDWLVQPYFDLYSSHPSFEPGRAGCLDCQTFDIYEAVDSAISYVQTVNV
jgi:hypothetical protein